MPTRYSTAIYVLRHAARPVLRQRDVAVLVGITQTSISEYERGEISDKMTLMRAMELAAALGSTVEAVFPALWSVAREKVDRRRHRQKEEQFLSE